MKKYLPHIILLIVLTGAVFMILTGDRDSSKKRLNERLSFRVKDKIPYGYWVAYNNLKYLFPKARVSTNGREPGYWDSLSVYDTKQALLIFSPYFFPEEEELTKLLDFAKNGNDVFISSFLISKDAQDIFRITTPFFNYTDFFDTDNDDSLNVFLQTDSVTDRVEYGYPGKAASTFMTETDNTITYKLGFDELNRPNFVRFRKGKGNIYVHTAPLAFSNYFLLYKSNMDYYESALSFIPKDVKQVVWDEYYLRKQYFSSSMDDERNNDRGFMSVLFQYRGLKWAFLSALILLSIYLLIEMRRKQRYIPDIKKPANDSLEFVKTIGRLYFEKGNHNNLSRKLATYFLEHIRNRYNLVTTNLDEKFIRTVQFKTGYPENELQAIVNFINNLHNEVVTDGQLRSFHQKLEDFYRKT